MPRFLVGDSLGSIKTIQFSGNGRKAEAAPEPRTVLDGSNSGKGKAVQGLSMASPATHDSVGQQLLASTFADGTASIYSIEDGPLKLVHTWKETRFKAASKFVGLAFPESGVYTCTSNGALRLTPVPSSSSDPTPLPTKSATLPMRLQEWCLAPDSRSFSYGGDEVELSVWDTEKAFALPLHDVTSPEGQKRKRSEALLPAETWRAKNVPNDNLSLRVPVHNTCLTYLEPAQSSKGCHLMAGTAGGHVRRYDTRAARRPVANWANIVKSGAVHRVVRGWNENEAFVSDHNSNLSAVDLRTGYVLYSYKGIAGTVAAHTPSLLQPPHLLASASNDRYLRLHSTVPPGSQTDKSSGEVIEKVYLGALPTAVVWDNAWAEEDEPINQKEGEGGNADDDESDAGEDVWEAMEDAEEESETSDADTPASARRNKGKRRRAA